MGRAGSSWNFCLHHFILNFLCHFNKTKAKWMCAVLSNGHVMFLSVILFQTVFFFSFRLNNSFCYTFILNANEKGFFAILRGNFHFIRFRKREIVALFGFDRIVSGNTHGKWILNANWILTHLTRYARC